MKPNPVWLVPPIAIGGAAVLPGLGLASPFTADPQERYRDGDMFWNYDFRDNGGTSSDNVDWPVNMIWGKEASVADVDQFFENRGWESAGFTEYLLHQESEEVAPEWAYDNGMKSPCENYTNDPYYGTSGKRNMHTRLYGAGVHNPLSSRVPGQFYNTSWGYYILATHHYDMNHSSGCVDGPERSGYSETVGDRVANIASNAGCTVYSDNVWMANDGYGGYTHVSHHYHESDGYATRIQFTPNADCK